MIVFFITHPEVRIVPDTPVPEWSLSEQGAARMQAFAQSDTAANIAHIWSSGETKAVEAAEILAAARGAAPVRIEPSLHENDRSATGFLQPPEFETVANAFFANPTESVRGWETAAHAQARIADAVDRILMQAAPQGDLAIVAHGGVGTLLLCRYLNTAISRAHDQPSQGHYWRFDARTREVLHGWRKL